MEKLVKNSTGKAVCPYCGVGCVIRATVEDNKITRISADDDTAPNFGMLCPKGAHLKQAFQNHDRSTSVTHHKNTYSEEVPHRSHRSSSQNKSQKHLSKKAATIEVVEIMDIMIISSILL